MIGWLAAAIVLTGATVHTGEGPPLTDASVLMDGERIVAVGRDVRVPADALRIDAEGSVVTPGLVDAHTRLGLADHARGVPAVVEAVVGPTDDPVRAALRVLDTFNPDSVSLPVARAGGVTSALVAPRGGIVSGQSILIDLALDDPVRERNAALHVSVKPGSQPGGRSRAFLRLREALEDARLYRANRGPFISRKLRELSVSAADLEVFERALAGALPVVIEVDRASDIRSALRLAREYRLDAVLLGAREGWKVADAIARAEVPVLVNPLQNLPTADAPFSRSDNAALLHAAGVELALTMRGEVHLVHRLRQAAGNAVAAGLPYDVALAAVTRTPSEIMGFENTGVLRRGALANVVVWNGDPLEVTSWATRVFVRGRQLDLTTRQDELLERYR